MKMMYLSFVKASKNYTSLTHERFVVMRNCVTELYSMDPVSGYQHAFVYLRQLAIHVRKAMTSMNAVDIHSVYSWQFVNCLRLWTYMVIEPSLKEAFQPLVYPLIQVIESTVNLIPTVRYYPVRLHCVDLFIQITAATGVYIPVPPLLLEVIENEKFMEKPAPVTAKPPDVNFAIKVSKTFVGSGRSGYYCIACSSLAG